MKRGELSKKLATNLRNRRGDKSLMEFGRKTGISYATLSRIESEQQNVSLDTLEKICISLNCDISDLFK
ncbi:MAG: helix-turn-helix domain-containing protein [Gammaproteobacteria bacterium]|nr:helix-turn-helix domain-containing protein [Gammaproteobacteria bacterium]